MTDRSANAGVRRSAVHQPVAVPKGPVAQPPKTSAYLNRKIATTKTANFWGELTKMAEKAGKIETIDNKLNPLGPTLNQTSIDMR